MKNSTRRRQVIADDRRAVIAWWMTEQFHRSEHVATTAITAKLGD
jgi:hypothetical protein